MSDTNTSVAPDYQDKSREESMSTEEVLRLSANAMERFLSSASLPPASINPLLAKYLSHESMSLMKSKSAQRAERRMQEAVRPSDLGEHQEIPEEAISANVCVAENLGDFDIPGPNSTHSKTKRIYLKDSKESK